MAPVLASLIDRVRRPTMGNAGALLVVGGGFAMGARSLSDNSFLTHLSTGRLILSEGFIPTRDPYTFTATGEPWVVQSWLASVIYAFAERIGGLITIRIFVACITAALGGLVWALLRRAEGVVTRLCVATLVLIVGTELWSERPYMIGLVAFALTALAAEGRLDPRWLIPIGWVWVNTHGSFPLGIVYLIVVAIGSRLDTGSWALELRCLRWAAGGVLLGAVGPLGIGALLFPVDLLQRQDLLSNVIEWQSPTFTSLAQRAFIVQLITSIIILARRPSYRTALVLGVFGAAALLGTRNVVVASLAILPGMAAGLDDVGNIASRVRGRASATAMVGSLVLVLLFAVSTLQRPDLTLERYPVDVFAFLENASVDTQVNRVSAPDYVGNYVELTYGAERRVFYDDRFDMFPEAVSKAYLAFARAEMSSLRRLGELDIDLAAVPRASPMGRVLTSERSWRLIFGDDRWVLACRRGQNISGDIGVC